ncbi:uncharacterized protein EV422DRAFT_128572 [Fimicolochytrium jonesii]|uniref:uncharacterized protein n=1 Tax=Fimicolochytrium jonesii TaxID=1396493 RepID=UPI0022FE3CAC|nr:uncharacterized protein EV422DRAFT_128572 [Fimicolochytrium jonesii]KAI8818986.1 hypothetical protein EV422DRAFT_128572 [Fimicolochytrium jonesii]
MSFFVAENARPAGGHGRWHTDGLSSMNFDGSIRGGAPNAQAPSAQQPPPPHTANNTIYFGASLVDQSGPNNTIPYTRRPPEFATTLNSDPVEVIERRQQMKDDLAHWAKVQMKEKEERRKEERKRRVEEERGMYFPFGRSGREGRGGERKGGEVRKTVHNGAGASISRQEQVSVDWNSRERARSTASANWGEAGRASADSAKGVSRMAPNA